MRCRPTISSLISLARQSPSSARIKFGGTIGGPVLFPKYNGRDKTFFFFSWESLHQNAPSAAVNSVVPTLADRATILDPTSKAIVAFYPLPNILNSAPGAANFVGNPASRQTDNTYLGKIDQNFGQSDRLTLRYLWYGGTAFSAGPL